MKDLWSTFEHDSSHYNTHTSLETFEYSLNISLKYNYLYTETPKVACSSIKTILQKMELDNLNLKYANFEDIHNRNLSPLLRPSQVKPLNEFLSGKRLFKFCFSRNPYTRILSAYIDKIKNNKPEKHQVLEGLGKNNETLETEVTFSEFIDFISKQQIENMNPHWRVQYYQTYQNRINYDFIGKFENLEKDLTKVLSVISPDFEKYITKEDRHATNANELMNEYYTESLINIIRKKYALDFKHFDYNPEIK